MADAETWAVLRQDDNGNRFVVRVGLSREEAVRLVVELEALGHKQTYWVEAEPDAFPPGAGVPGASAPGY